MAEAATLEARALAEELHAFLVELDPTRWRVDAVDAARAAAASLHRRAAAWLAAWEQAPSASEALHRAMARLADGLAEAASVGAGKTDWARAREHLVPLYVAVADALGQEAVPIDRRPSNLRRSIAHMACGVGVVAAFSSWPAWPWVRIAGAWFVFVWTVEVARRLFPWVQTAIMTAVRDIARPHEFHKVAGSTWYSTALLVIAVLSPTPAGMLGVLVLGVGDPVAGELGRRFGRHRWFGRKSVEGSVAFVASSCLAGALYLGLVHPQIAPAQAGVMIGAAAFVGAAVELVSTRVDDNLSIPLAAGAAAWIAAALVGAQLA